MVDSGALSASPILRRRSGWTLHAKGMLGIVVVCIFLAALAASACHYVLTSKWPGVSPVPSLLFGAVAWLWWGMVAAGMWLAGQRISWLLRFSFKSIVIQIITAGLSSFVHLEILQLTVRIDSIYWHRWGEAYSSLNFINLGRFGLDLASYGVIFGLSGLLHMQSQRQQDAIQKIELERQLSQAQLRALQMQMEPHFLFNTLNAITSLIAQDRNKEAMKTMSHLNTILRTTLQRKTPEKVPFVEELRVVESYLAIQQVRFAGRLEVKIDATPEALDGLVPCFLLQPIVENAIKHGIAPMEAGGLIETHVKRVGDKLWMQVKDNGCGANGSHTKGHGIGMQNIRERLAYFYPDAHGFDVVAPIGGGYEVTIQIPYERAIA
jgi:sensor histidine kinase YesM